METAAKEDGPKEAIDKISSEITAVGGKVETVQKMEKKSFVRVANKKHSSGYYVNVIFESEPSALEQLKHRLAMNTEIFRVLLTKAPPAKAALV